MNETTSAFDLDAFMSATVTDANDTKITPVPEGEYMAVISKTALKQIEKGTMAGRLVLDVTYEIDDQAARDATGMDKPTVRQGIFLDTTEHGTLEVGKGKNVTLGKLREAVGLNVPGKPFAFSMLFGLPVRILVKHRQAEDGTIFTDVKGTLAP